MTVENQNRVIFTNFCIYITPHREILDPSSVIVATFQRYSTYVVKFLCYGAGTSGFFLYQVLYSTNMAQRTGERTGLGLALYEAQVLYGSTAAFTSSVKRVFVFSTSKCFVLNTFSCTCTYSPHCMLQNGESGDRRVSDEIG